MFPQSNSTEKSFKSYKAGFSNFLLSKVKDLEKLSSI